MKIEQAPDFLVGSISNYLEDITNGTYEDFIQVAQKHYWYWDEVKYRPNLPKEDAEKAWKILKTHRLLQQKNVSFGKHTFTFNSTPYIQEQLHNFDLKLMGGLFQNAISLEDRRDFLKGSLIDEAIASSQIEGAATTTKVAEKMIRADRKPRNEGEQMILNNVRAIKAIEARKSEPLSHHFILEIHRLMTAQTSAEKFAGNYRDGEVSVYDHIDNSIAFTAPSSSEVQPMVNELISFINDENIFTHPIVKASILHFMIGFVHPFGDGNGRTARALFYWFMMKNGYELIKHISISRAILDSRTSYDKAFLKTEYDSNDMTYFIMYSLKSLKVAFEQLVTYRDKKKKEKEQINLLSQKLLSNDLNKRQAELISYLSYHSQKATTIKAYADKNNVTRQTARRDLHDLRDSKWLVSYKEGRLIKYKLTRHHTL